MGPGESMSIWHLLFSFDGRISRKTYVITITVLTLVAAALMLAGATLVTGDPFSLAFWGLRPENISVWGPLWGRVVAGDLAHAC
ncbi:MAG: hypothetical protein ACXWJH_05555, partial [Hyphomicrobium sp.]